MVPDMALAQRCWVATSKENPTVAAEVLQAVKEKKMAPWYAHLSSLHPALFPPDEGLLAEMKAENEAELKRISEVCDKQFSSIITRSIVDGVRD